MECERHHSEAQRPGAPDRRVVSDANSVPGDSGPGPGRELRPARLPGRQDRTRLKRVGGSTLQQARQTKRVEVGRPSHAPEQIRNSPALRAASCAAATWSSTARTPSRRRDHGWDTGLRIGSRAATDTARERAAQMRSKCNEQLELRQGLSPEPAATSWRETGFCGVAFTAQRFAITITRRSRDRQPMHLTPSR
jgi:hypothetical protein